MTGKLCFAFSLFQRTKLEQSLMLLHAEEVAVRTRKREGES